MGPFIDLDVSLLHVHPPLSNALWNGDARVMVVGNVDHAVESHEL